MKIIGENLKRLRLSKGWSQEKLAKRIGIHRTTYTKYERGLVDPPLMQCVHLCAVLRTDMNELLGIKRPRYDIDLPMEDFLTEEEERWARERWEEFVNDPSWDGDKAILMEYEEYIRENT